MSDPSGGSARSARVLEGYDDRELVELLRERGCDGPMWLDAVDALATYSLQVFTRTFRAGSLTSRTRNRGRTVWFTPTEWHDLLRDVGQREDLFYAALHKQLALFAERTCAGYGWVDGGGMSLRDYFCNGVLLQLGNPVKSWRRARARDAAVRALSPQELELVAGAESSWGPEEEFVAGESAASVTALLGRADPRLRRAILLRVDTGAPWGHIAREVGLSEHALEGHRRRFRQSVQQERDTRGENPS